MKIKLYLFWLLFVGLFVVLGIWQLYRYHYKKELQQAASERLVSQPVALAIVSDHPLEFQRIAVRGSYLNQAVVLMQDQIYQHRLGFEVFTLFKPQHESQYMLVDRGWLPAQEEGKLPVIPAVDGEQKLVGYLKTYNAYQFILGKNILYPEARPLVIQKIDFAELSNILKLPLFPFVLRLDKNMPHGFTRDWIISTMPPERHLGYAVQWFSMAIVLLIAASYFCLRRK